MRDDTHHAVFFMIYRTVLKTVVSTWNSSSEKGVVSADYPEKMANPEGINYHSH
jgi:hypothetical protein